MSAWSAPLGISGSGSLSTITYTVPTEDTWVRDGSYSNTKYGSTPAIELRTPNACCDTRISLLKFHSTLLPLATKARLRLFVTSISSSLAQSRNISVARMPSNFSLHDKNATWNNTPRNYEAIGRSTLIVMNNQVKQWVEVDITDLILGHDITLALNVEKQLYDNYLRFDSKESDWKRLNL